MREGDRCYTRGLAVCDGLLNHPGVVIGLLLGPGGAFVVQAFGSPPAFFEQVAVIFGVAPIVLYLCFLLKASNLLDRLRYARGASVRGRTLPPPELRPLGRSPARWPMLFSYV